jgi:dTDP-glucose 4,6-dehydratase
MRWLITGGCGFIGSAVVRRLLGVDPPVDGGIDAPVERLVLLDLLSYAGRLDNLGEAQDDPRLRFVRGDVADSGLVRRLLAEHRPDLILHLAAESHVDRSLVGSAPFLHTNVQGTQVLIEAWLAYGGGRFVQFSTDEVYGDLAASERSHEDSPLLPSSPYAASKAAGDMLVRAAVRSWGLDAVITRSSNNLGPRQHPEKLIPRMIARALHGQELPVYGSGGNLRDWIWVHDNAEALLRAALLGGCGRVYNLGAGQERSNLQVVHGLLERLGASPSLIRHVADRPGHDQRYALCSDRAAAELGWRAGLGFEEALDRTVAWYLRERPWWESTMEPLAGGTP